MALMSDRYKAGSATYPGDHTGSLDQVKGPTNYGTYVIVSGAKYDESTDSTILYFEHLTEDEHVLLMKMISRGTRV